ncbi:MAG: AsmA-like C-terminal region-containing protein, partial [Pseudomonadota bacterium]
TLTGGVRGSLRLSAAQPSVLARWWSGAAAPNPLGGTIDPILLETDLSISQDAIDANRLSLRIGAAAASGRITYVRTERPRLELSLASPRLTLEGVAGALSLFGTATTLTGPLPDLVLDLSAQEVLIDEIAGAAVNIDGTLIEDTLTIDAIAAEDLAGATVFASGTIGSVSTAPVGTISGTLIMTDGARLRTALEAFDTASPIIPWLRARLPLLTPADVRFSVAGGVDPNTPALDFEASGLLAGTDFVVSGSTTTILADWAQTPMDLQAEALSPESATLLAQLGLEALPSGTPGRIELSLNGAPAEGLSTSAAANLLGVEATFLGTLQLADGLTPQGDVSLNIATFTPLLTALELEAPDPGPFTATAQLSAQDQTANTITAREVTGSLGAQPFRGSLTWSALGLGGALAVEEVDVGALAALVLGENAFLADPAEPAPWPNSAFSDPIFAGVDVTIATQTERLLMGPYTIEDAQFELSLSDDGLVIDGGTGTLMGGALAGTLTLLREGSQAALTSDIAILGATLPQLWQESGAPTQGGQFDLTATAASSGFTVAGLVANLSGEGSLVAQEVGVTGITTAPFAPPAAQGDAPLTEAAVRSELDDHLDAGAITLQTLDAPFTIDGGVMRFETITGRLTSSDGSASETATASIDLSTSTLTGTIDGPLGVQDAPDLSASATFSGSLTAPQRTLDVSSLVAWLNLKALEEQVEAVEAQNEALEDEANALEPAPLAGDQAPEDGTPPPAGNAIDAGPDGTGEDAAEAQTGAATPQTEPATPQSQDVPLPPPAPALPDRANAGAVGN